ncbi:nucleoside-diphosphate kinase [Arcanobacterium wilhelmae]|uniref:nucleoside-diphosphate kinase n=1 Tax=Arcanobacterium wilhelmae TaxID=1803177 RepID=A0ABT9NA09_9ACTO|nr:nucleoside-diphosphate kinase [Arcanobacterium wilhelmae]MDP9800340.1 nucleoside-diphosphate kinase [Arcanobacterium wilhelmae]WFN89776.1 nucleoside-diphosphate kinase [Arcanobacterium wilhelmae]
MRTLILLKPDAVRRHLAGEILARIERKGYTIDSLKMLTASAEQLAAHYAEHVDKPFYASMAAYMSSGPIVAAVISGERVIEGVRSLSGATDPTSAAPGTIRGDFGRDWGTEAIENLIHSSDSLESAEREIAVWF